MDAPFANFPRTLAEARDFDLSQTTRTSIELAGQIAAALPGREGRPRAVGLGELIGGIVAVGQRERGFSRQAEGKRGGFLVAGALAEALEGLVGLSRIEEAIALVRGTPDAEVALSPRVTEALAAARAVAEATAARARIDARHLIAVLVAPPSPGLGAALRRVWWRDWAVSPDSLRGPILAAIERNPESSEDLAAWRRILGVPRLAPAAFAADAPAAGDDALGRRTDARRLAELACLTDNAPPLAIGLFGDWGSGKSTFMAMMQGEVARIGAAWKGEAASPFATRVAQIRFNAWSFADANLWASLALEIFEGLRDELARIEGTGDAQSRRAATLLAEISARSEQARAARRQADDAVATARKALDDVEQRLRALDAKLAGPGAAAARVGAIVAARRGDIAALLRDLGTLGPGEAATVERLGEEVRTLAAAGTGGFAVGRRVVRLATSRIGLTLAAAITLAALAAWLAPRGAIETLAATLAFLAPFAARIVTALNRLSPLLDAVEADAKAEADLRRERAALAEARDAAARSLAEREAAAAKALWGAEAIEKAAATPQAMLRFFLNESEELRGYEREIGLIGRLRRSFQRLDDLMAAQADPARETRDDLPVLDRIILYIDDLDRLREDQVVKVLEAVALLLQFRLFVVVVAVDARWLEGALRSFYAAQFIEGQAGPGDYLEKIFQVPFWLPRLAAGEAFQGLARSLMPEGAANAEAPIAAPAEAAPAPAGDEYALDPDEAPQPGDEAPAETRAAAVERVTLTPAEVEALTALLPLAATGPRGAKRFVNLYRLARASRGGDELRRFLGEAGEAPDFPALAFMLACECGMPNDERRLTQITVAEREPDALVAGMPRLFFSDPGCKDRERHEAVHVRLRRAMRFWDRLVGELRYRQLQEALFEAQRYSFHPPPPLTAPPLPPTLRPNSPGAPHERRAHRSRHHRLARHPEGGDARDAPAHGRHRQRQCRQAGRRCGGRAGEGFLRRTRHPGGGEARPEAGRCAARGARRPRGRLGRGECGAEHRADGPSRHGVPEGRGLAQAVPYRERPRLWSWRGRHEGGAGDELLRHRRLPEIRRPSRPPRRPLHRR